jgi:hypothetical protein
MQHIASHPQKASHNFFFSSPYNSCTDNLLKSSNDSTHKNLNRHFESSAIWRRATENPQQWATKWLRGIVFCSDNCERFNSLPEHGLWSLGKAEREIRLRNSITNSQNMQMSYKFVYQKAITVIGYQPARRVCSRSVSSRSEHSYVWQSHLSAAFQTTDRSSNKIGKVLLRIGSLCNLNKMRIKSAYKGKMMTDYELLKGFPWYLVLSDLPTTDLFATN